MLCLPSHQASAELRQHTEMEARIRQLELECVFPINAGAHGIGGLAVTQMLQKLENSHQGQPPWRKARLASLGIKRFEIFVLVELAERVTQSGYQRALEESCAGDPRSFNRDLAYRHRMQAHVGPLHTGAAASNSPTVSPFHRGAIARLGGDGLAAACARSAGRISASGVA